MAESPYEKEGVSGEGFYASKVTEGRKSSEKYFFGEISLDLGEVGWR